MEIVDSLPERPLKTAEIEKLHQSDRLTAVPVTGHPADDNIFAVLLRTDSAGYAVGFDDEEETWSIIEKATDTDEESEVKVLETATKEWIEERYGSDDDLLMLTA